MYDETYQPTGTRLQRFLRAISATARLGQPFGVEVRLYWIALIVPLIILWEMREIDAQYLSASARVGFALAFSASLFFIIYTHEMGHIAAGWRYRIPSRMITLSPMGGLAHMDSSAPRPSAEAVIALAGPAVHLVWLGVLAPLHVWGPDLFGAANWRALWMVEFLWDLNLALLVFNLLPLYPMDGGRVLRALLCSKLHANRATIVAAYVGMVGAVGIGLYGLFSGALWGTILLLIGITNFFACRRAVIAAKYQESPYAGPGESLAAWQADPDAWKHGGTMEQAWGGSDDEEPAANTPRSRGPGRLRQWRERRAKEKAIELAQELDRILEKISQVGMNGLTRHERKILERASKEARKR